MSLIGFIRSLFSFEGRINRVQLILGHFASLYLGGLIFLIVLSVLWLFGLFLYRTFPDYIVYSIWLLYFLGAFIAAFTAVSFVSLYVRRLHDLNKSGYYLFLIFIPVVGQLLWFFWMFFLEGSPGTNDYGEASYTITSSAKN